MSKALRSFLLVSLLTAALPVAAETYSVSVVDSAFSPSQLTIQQGDTVSWINEGSLPHNVRADDGSFRCAQGCDGKGGNGSPSSSGWSFSLTFDDPGMIRYYCEVHGAPGGIGMAGSITVEPSDTGGEEPGEAVAVFVPIAGSVMGNNNTFFRTFLRVFNPSATETALIGGSFLKTGQDNTSAPEVSFMLAPGEVKIFEDVVSSLFSESGLGAIRLHSDSNFMVTSRIFTDSQCNDPSGGTFGQFAPGFNASEALTSGVILHLNFSSEFRSNIGFANTTDSQASVTVRLWGPAGMMAEQVIPIDPRGAVPPTALSSVFGLPALDQENLYVTFTSDQPVFGYGSAVDNATQDQIFISARPMM